jgi:H+/Cl- antiporter ClcA
MADILILIGLLMGVFASFAAHLFIHSLFRAIDRREQQKPYLADLVMWIFSGVLLVILVFAISVVIINT